MSDIAKDDEIILPVNTSKDFLERVMKAYFEVEAFKKPTTLDNVAQIVGSKKSNISMTNSFLNAIGAIEKSGREISLTELGEKYSQTLSWGLEDDSKLYLRELLVNYTLTKLTISYIRVQKNVTADELEKRIGILSSKKISDPMRRAIRSFIEFLLYTEILNETDGIIKAPEILPLNNTHTIEFPKDKTSSSVGFEILQGKIPVMISLSIDANMSEKEIIQKIKAIRKGLLAPLEKGNDNEEGS